MRQFRTILKFELKNYFKNKSFVGITLFLVLAITVVMFFPRVASLFKKSGESDSAERAVMLVKADVGENADIIGAAFASYFPEYDVKVTDKSDEEIKSSVTDGDAECAFVMTAPNAYTYYVDNLSIYDSNTAVASEALTDVYRMSAMISGGMSPEAVGEIMSAGVTGETVSLGKDQSQNFFYTYIMIFALYMVILLYGQMVATSVATEKSSRAMELLITSAKPVAMMFGKVIAACLAGLVQLASVFGSAIVFYKVNESYWGGNQIIESIFGMPVGLLVYMLVFFILGFFIYAFLYGAIGSTASKLEDINTSVMPLTFIFVIAFIVVMTAMADGNVDSLLMRICSYIPFTSPMAMFTRIAMSTVPIYEIAVSIAILLASVFAVGVLSAKIYRVGVVLYGTPPKPKAIIKAIRKG